MSQEDIAALLGLRTAGKVSRYEQRRRLPTLQTALAYEAIFGTSVSDLFGGLYDGIRKDIKRRAGRLARRLSIARNSFQLARKKGSLQAIVSR